MRINGLRLNDGFATTLGVSELLVRFGLGDVIRKLRGEETQKHLAERADVDPGALIYLERGERNTDLMTITKLAEALHVPLADLWECVEQLKWIDLLAGLQKAKRGQVLDLAKRLSGLPQDSEQSPVDGADPPATDAGQSSSTQRTQGQR